MSSHQESQKKALSTAPPSPANSDELPAFWAYRAVSLSLCLSLSPMCRPDQPPVDLLLPAGRHTPSFPPPLGPVPSFITHTRSLVEVKLAPLLLPRCSLLAVQKRRRRDGLGGCVSRLFSLFWPPSAVPVVVPVLSTVYLVAIRP